MRGKLNVIRKLNEMNHTAAFISLAPRALRANQEPGHPEIS
jgi:hypothetical protein